MAKKDKKVPAPTLSKKELKAEAKAKAQALAKKMEAEAEAKQKAESKKGKKDGKKAKSTKQESLPSKATPKKGKANTDWDETEGSGGDFFKVESGKHLCRVRSVISVGQCQFEFNGVKDAKATSGMAIVAEVWPYKVDKKKGKIKLLSKEPAIVQGVVKALKGNAKSNYEKMLKAMDVKHVSEIQDVPCGMEVYTSDKGYMYLKNLYSVGIAEGKAIPKLTQKGHLIPNLDCMTPAAMLDLNPITQVKDYVLMAVNYPGSEAEKIVNAIRKDKPEYAKLKAKEGDDKTKPKKKGKKKKLDGSKTY